MMEKCKFILVKINIFYMLVRSMFVYLTNDTYSVRFSEMILENMILSMVR